MVEIAGCVLYPSWRVLPDGTRVETHSSAGESIRIVKMSSIG